MSSLHAIVSTSTIRTYGNVTFFYMFTMFFLPPDLVGAHVMPSTIGIMQTKYVYNCIYLHSKVSFILCPLSRLPIERAPHLSRIQLIYFHLYLYILLILLFHFILNFL